MAQVDNAVAREIRKQWLREQAASLFPSEPTEAPKHANITVNGRPVEEFLGEEKSLEITSFVRAELRSMRRTMGRR